MPRRGNPDYVVDPDRGSGTTAAKTATLLDVDVDQGRTEARSGLRDLDAMTEALPGLSRLRRDRERLFPRGTTADLSDPRMRRPMPVDGQIRGPLSARQRNARSKARRRALAGLPEVQLRAQHRLVSNLRTWRRTNDQLSEHTSDLQALPDADQVRIRRIDRSIQAYERLNDRGHVLYANVAMPWYINHQNIEGFARNNFEVGRRLSFDRYTVATHQLHETARHVADARGSVAVFEMQTRRGAYMGHSDKKDSTGHLLPRGMEFEVIGVHQATYRAPDGTSGIKTVVQLRDITPEP